MDTKVINIFFAYASDSEDLLAAAQKEIKIINRSIRQGVQFRIKEWKSDTIAEMGNPEQCILEQMPIDECNYFIWVFRFIYGQPTGNKDPETGEEYGSGMEEEFFTAYHHWKTHKDDTKLRVFKSTEDVPRKYASDYIASDRIKKFFEDFASKGKHPGLFKEYKSEDEFRELFRQSILTDIFSRFSQDRTISSRSSTVYFDGENEERNRVKQQDLQSTKSMRLQANSGFSFLVPKAVHSVLLRTGLDRGMKVKIIIPNPWSANAVRTLLREGDFKSTQDYNKYLRGELDVTTLMDVYCNSQWRCSRLMPCIQSYLALKKDYKALIELRLSDCDLSNSILLTDQHLFFEPFVNAPEADKRYISVFEVQVPADSTLYEDTSIYFEKLWKTGCPYRKYVRDEEFFKERLKKYFDNRSGE